MGWTGEGIRALKEKRKTQLEAKAKEAQTRQALQPPALASRGLPLTEEPRHRIYEEEQAKREQPQGTPSDPPEDAPHQPIRLWHAVGISVAVLVVLVMMMDYMADRLSARRAEQAKFAVQKAEQQAAERKEAAAQRVKEEAEFGRVLTDGQ